MHIHCTVSLSTQDTQQSIGISSDIFPEKNTVLSVLPRRMSPVANLSSCLYRGKVWQHCFSISWFRSKAQIPILKAGLVCLVLEYCPCNEIAELYQKGQIVNMSKDILRDKQIK